MAKEIFKKVKLQIPAGKANPAPPVGTVLGPVGINLQEFCQKFNDASKDRMGDIVPVEITIYQDKTYDFVLKTTPAPVLIKKYAKILLKAYELGSSTKAELLQAVGDPNFDQPNQWSDFWRDAKIQGLLDVQGKNVRSGKNLEDYVKTYELEKFM